MAKKKSQFVSILILMFGDFIAISIAFICAYYERFYFQLFPVQYEIPSIYEYIKLYLFAGGVFFLLLVSLGLYSRTKIIQRVDEFLLIVKTATLTLVLVMAATFLYRQFSYSRIVIAISWVNVVFFITILRTFVHPIIFYIEEKYKFYTRVAIVGNKDAARMLATKIKKNKKYGYSLVGFIGLDEEIKNDSTVIGTTKEIKTLIQRYFLDEIILADPTISQKKMLALMMECEKHMIAFRVIPDMFGIITSKVDLQSLGGVALLGIKNPALYGFINRVVKRIVDIFGALVGLVLFSPFFLVVSIMVKATSKGPILYKQERIGEDGKLFTMFKFRTMVIDAEELSGPVWAKENDPRTTKYGAWMRQYNIDELPQLLNVLRGEMSLVGPRPERPHFVNQFKEDIPRYMARHKIKSGMTGWAQINGFRGDTSIEERTKYDLYYIENWSLFLDIKIILLSLTPSGLKNAY